MNSAFDGQKRKAVSEYKAALHAGDVDEELVKTIELVDYLPDYYVTSTCAGRIALLSDAGSKKESAFLGKWHRQVQCREVLDALKPSAGVTYFRFEPAILHVVARNLAAADRMMKAALASGLKRSGMQSAKGERIMIEILGTERIDVPVAEGSRVLVSEDYLSFLVSVANEKYSENLKKIRQLEREISALGKS
jgi:tRNA wybutosine-synthesizing protein 3